MTKKFKHLHEVESIHKVHLDLSGMISIGNHGCEAG